MKKTLHLFGCLLFLIVTLPLFAQQPKPPIMGWSSWNHFHVNIDEPMIRQQADALIVSGMYKAGYRFINIDDGYSFVYRLGKAGKMDCTASTLVVGAKMCRQAGCKSG